MKIPEYLSRAKQLAPSNEDESQSITEIKGEKKYFGALWNGSGEQVAVVSRIKAGVRVGEDYYQVAWLHPDKRTIDPDTPFEWLTEDQLVERGLFFEPKGNRE